jgi:hypothetical protein
MKKKNKNKRTSTSSKQGRPGKSKRAVAEVKTRATKRTRTRSRVEGIIRGYGTPNVNGSTIVGPAVPSMNRFTGDVNRSFGKSYVPGELHAEWDVDTTAKYIDQRRRTPLGSVGLAADTRSRVEGIIRGYGTPNVNGSTIVGPAVPSMDRFKDDVNTEFGKHYVLGQLHAEWDVDITANFIDTH